MPFTFFYLPNKSENRNSTKPKTDINLYIDLYVNQKLI